MYMKVYGFRRINVYNPQILSHVGISIYKYVFSIPHNYLASIPELVNIQGRSQK